MSRQKVNTLSNHEIAFTLATAWAATETLTLTFPAPAGAAGFDTSALLNSAPLDYDISWNGSNKTIVAAGSCAANSIEITSIVNATGVITFTLCSGSTASGGTDPIIIKIGTNASLPSAGTNQIKNPTSTPGSYKIAIGGTHADSGSLAVPILSNDQVTVTATVDPSITSSLSATSCSLGTLTTAITGFCPITNTVDTNATSGYTASVADIDATTLGKLCSPSVVTCTNSIAAATTITHGTSGFGVRTNIAAQTVTNAGACADDTGQASTALTSTFKSYGSAAGPAASSASILCYKAAISATQAAGSYTNVSTHLTTGNF
jgi:hypothetical protein